MTALAMQELPRVSSHQLDAVAASAAEEKPGSIMAGAKEAIDTENPILGDIIDMIATRTKATIRERALMKLVQITTYDALKRQAQADHMNTWLDFELQAGADTTEKPTRPKQTTAAVVMGVALGVGLSQLSKLRQKRAE